MKNSIFLSLRIIGIKQLKKSLSYGSLLCIILFSASCGSDSEDEMMNNGNQDLQMGFTIDTDEYQTPNAYLIFHDVIQYDPINMVDVIKIKNQFSFLFMQGQAIINDGDILYSVDTKQSSYHYFRDIGATPLLDDIQSLEITPDIYSQSPNTTTRVDISDIEEDIIENGVGYGDPVFAGINYPLADNDDASFKINSIDINYETMMGTIDCEYNIGSGFAGEIAGKFIGSFSILIE